MKLINNMNSDQCRDMVDFKSYTAELEDLVWAYTEVMPQLTNNDNVTVTRNELKANVDYWVQSATSAKVGLEVKNGQVYNNADEPYIPLKVSKYKVMLEYCQLHGVKHLFYAYHNTNTTYIFHINKINFSELNVGTYSIKRRQNDPNSKKEQTQVYQIPLRLAYKVI